MVERAADRFVRLVALISFLEASGPVTVDKLAGHFGVTTRQILADVDTLWVSGTPGYWPNDLIDFDSDAYDRGVVCLTEARGMTRPLRLGTREAISLVAALRALREVVANAGDAEQAVALESALRKLTDATGQAAAALDVRMTVNAAPAVLAAIRTATTTGRCLRLTYVNASDVTTVREVEPIRLVPSETFTYLHAWCKDSQGERTFRSDRILAAEVLDVPATHLAEVKSGPSLDFNPGAGTTATVVLSSQARWVAEQIPVESLTTLDDSSCVMTLRVRNPVWLRHLLLRNARGVLSVAPQQVRDDATSAARTALAEYAALGLTADD